MARKGFTLVELLIVIIIISLLAALLLPALVKAICAAKETKAMDLITNIENACKIYERDFNSYPAGAAVAPFYSKWCADALSKPGPRKQPYIEWVAGDLDGNGNVRNPVNPQGMIYYRNNIALNPKPPEAKNKYSVDLWCENCEGVATGVNNWRAPE
jgi:prepilin-type N-terminal cleavage/methylation domain-containing protein